MKLKIILGVILLLIFSTINFGYTLASDLDILEGGPAEWEKYALDEEASKGMLYCRATKGSSGNVVETRWYSYFVNPNELVRTDEGDTRTPNCESPNFTPVYARGSNKDKIYSRLVMNNDGGIRETVWYSACTEEEIRRDEGDTTYAGSDSFTGKCYHPDYVTDVEEKTEEQLIEEEIMKSPAVSFGQKIVNWFKKLFGM